MSQVTLIRVSRATFALIVVIAAIAVLLHASSWSAPMPAEAWGIRSFLALFALVSGGVGLRVLQRHPNHRVGWLFAAIGLIAAIGEVAAAWSIVALVDRPGSLPGGEVAAWLVGWIWIPLNGLLAILLLSFPGGALPTPRWKPFVAIGVAGVSVSSIVAALKPGPLDNTPDVVNPFGLPIVAQVLGENPAVASAVVIVPLVGFTAAACGSLGVRFRRARGLERQQLKWLLVAAVSTVVTLLIAGVLTSASDELLGVGDAQVVVEISEILVMLAFLGVPLGAGLAILRYRLYDVDRIISRSVSYALLSTLLAGTFAGLVLGIQALLGDVTGGDTLAVAASTLAVFALFQPLRRRIQAAMDRRFNRARIDAEAASARFAERLRDEVDLPTIRAETARVLIETMRPRSTGVWLRDRSR